MKFIAVFIVGLLPMQLLLGQQQSRTHVLKYTLNGVTTEISFINNTTAHIFKYRGSNRPDKHSLVVLNSRDAPVKTETSMGQQDNQFIIQSAGLRVELSKIDGTLQFYNNKDELLIAECPDQPADQQVDQHGFEKIDDSITHVAASFALSNGEAIYGLGQHQTGVMNQRGQTILLRQTNMDIAIPFLQSTKGYGLYWDNYSATIYHDSAGKMSLTSEAGSCIDYYLIAGENADAIIGGYRKLTGTVPLFPLWSFGYIQSRERYQSQAQVVGVVKKYRELKVPLDAVVQDWQYWGVNDNWNATRFDNPSFSDPVSMIHSVHQMHAKLLISVWPSFGGKSKIYQEMNSKNMLFNFPTFPRMKSVKVYDAFNPEARNVYWKYLNKNLFMKGIDGWWLDATEPEQINTGKGHEPDAFNTAFIKDTKTYLGNYRSFTNAFPFETVNGVYTHQRAASSDKRVFILTRSAFAGQQRDGSMVWSGDITSSWQTLKRQIPAALNYSLSGLPYWNADIGGFFSGTNYPGGNKDLLYRELYIRWLQFGVFTAMMRSHGTNTPREIYQFGKPGDITFDIIRKYIGWRYTLEPYIYSTAWNITAKNASLMRALVMDYPGDKNVYDLGSEYLFGNAILVAPITDSIFDKTSDSLDLASTVKQKIYLPRGDWYDYNTDKRLGGHRTIVQAYTLTTMPVFVKSGSIIPLATVSEYSSIQHFKNLTIKVYPGRNADFELYEDEGDNYNYEKGKYSIIKFVWDDRAKTLTIDKRQGDFNLMIRKRTFEIKVAGLNRLKTVEYDGSRKVVRF
ncbi:MAG TPA: TIM-barrel domain-containing protein [Arachidicoccus sp.]|nr:TIM-barrel domain-containing protein [Arachidicoccus sp.]